MQKADAAAKAATTLQQFITQLPHPPAILKRIKEQVAEAARTPPSQQELTRLMGTFNPEETFKGLGKLSRPHATLIAQIRADHCPLNGYLHCFKEVDSPNCKLCKQIEDADHFLTKCKKFVGLRQ